MLNAMPPVLAYEGRETGIAALEKPIEVMVGRVTLDGETLGPDRLATFAYFVYRRMAPALRTTSGTTRRPPGAPIWTRP
jgi:hypothetical protein